MDNNARYSVIGLFATSVIAAVFGFVYWITAADVAGQPKPIDVVFSGSVTGLGKGADVLFNGIKVGQVKALSISPTDPKKVVARIEVDPAAPVKTDTQAILEFQGLTGIGFVQLSGGEPESPELLPQAGYEVAVIQAGKSEFQSILDGVKDTIGTASTALARLDGFLSDNEQTVASTLVNVEKFSGALAANSDGLQSFLASLANAGGAIAPLAAELTALSQDVRGVVAALKPGDIEKAISDVTTFTDAVARNSANVDSFFDQTTVLATNLAETSKGLQKTLEVIDRAVIAIDPQKIETAMAGMESFMNVVGSNAGVVDSTIKNVASLSRNLAAISAALPPEKIETAITNITAFTDTIAENNKNIDDFFVHTASAAANLDKVSGGFESTLKVIEEASQAIDPQKIKAAVDGVETFVASFTSNSENVETIIRNATEISDKLNVAAARVDGILTRVDGMVTGGTGEGALAEFGETARAIRVLAENLDKRTAEISKGLANFAGPGLREYQALATEGQKTLRNLDRIISAIERDPQRLLFGGENVRDYRRK